MSQFHFTAIDVLASTVEWAILGALVYGVYRWNRIAALLLFLHPIASTVFLAAFSAGQGTYAISMGQGRIVFLTIFLFLFAKAGLSINTFVRQQ